jgi:superfamily I DNA and/or RNA helicase
MSSCRDEPHWSNPGEAAIVLKLLQRLDPFPRKGENGYSDTPLAVLTPYRAQKQLLGGSSLAREHLSTIHAFQGREADVVIVSLVRDRLRGGRSSTNRIQAGLGHVAQSELVNVLFSRARRQLVIIGRFAHYASIMGPEGFWPRVCRAVELNGTILSARDIFGDLPPLVASRESPDFMNMAESG